jgi:predicted metalloprotease
VGHDAIVDFDDNARLDTSQVQDVRGRRTPSRGAAIGGGGGVVGIIIAVVVFALSGGDPSTLTQSVGGGTISQAGGEEDLTGRCKTGADADRDETCRVVGIVNSLQTFWGGRVDGYTPADTQLFTSATSTGCGSATSAVGPFYCPADDTVYVDLGFFTELQTTYGARGGDFAQAYVLAHEYGHHVQDVLGDNERASQLRQQKGAQGASVRLELQADCYAGTWAAGADLITFTQDDIDDGLSAAAAVGDDRIQEKATGRVDPETFSHGTAAQRQKWFRTGLAGKSCDTFTGTV